MSAIRLNFLIYWAQLCGLIYTLHLAVCSCHVTFPFQSDPTLYICLSVKELVTENSRDMWSLSEWYGTRIHNQLVGKLTLSHLSKLTQWLSWIVSTDPYSVFDIMFFSCHLRVLEESGTPYLFEYQGTRYSKQARNVKVKWLQRDSNL